MKLSDPATLWQFECLTDAAGRAPPGGLALQDLRHDGHGFARDLRVIGFWVEIETVAPGGAVNKTERRFFPLGAPTFTVAPIEVLTPQPLTNPFNGNVFQRLKDASAALDFAAYFTAGANHVGYGLRLDHFAPTFFAAWPNCAHTALSIQQIFLFSAYGNAPLHEPSGNLHAARCQPMLRFDAWDNPAVDRSQVHTRLGSIRFDYRVHLALDSQLNCHHVDKDPPGNNAGLFRDSDSTAMLGTPLWVAAKGAWNRSLSLGFSKVAFEAVEKPLVLEVVAPALDKGRPVYDDPRRQPNPVRCWDNVHWWGSRGQGAPMISTPGAFHAAHLHWRWGAAAATPLLGGQGSNPRFRGATTPSAPYPFNNALHGSWGPLVDPAIWIQTQRLAVVRNRPALDPATPTPAAALSTEDFETLFTALGSPADIEAGADIVLFYAIQVHRAVTIPAHKTMTSGNPVPLQVPATTHVTPLRGTVFLQGIFFAHDPEQTGATVGSTDPLHWPASAAAVRASRAWFRAGN